MPVVISNGLRAAREMQSSLRPHNHRQVISSLHIQQSGRSVKSMNAKNTKKSPIHENADANVTYEFGDGDISRSRSRLPHDQMASHIVSLIIVKWHQDPVNHLELNCCCCAPQIYMKRHKSFLNLHQPYTNNHNNSADWSRGYLSRIVL